LVLRAKMARKSVREKKVATFIVRTENTMMTHVKTYSKMKLILRLINDRVDMIAHKY
jgi:hypothetical protein